MWQNSGDDDSNWTNFIKSNFPFKALPFGFRRYSGKYSVQQTCPDTWNRCGNSSCFSAICPASNKLLNTCTTKVLAARSSSWRLCSCITCEWWPEQAAIDAQPLRTTMYMSTTAVEEIHNSLMATTTCRCCWHLQEPSHPAAHQ
jgi:hypothetical protein